MLNKVNFSSLRFKMSAVIITFVLVAIFLFKFQVIPQNKEFVYNLYKEKTQNHLQTLGLSILPYLLQNQIAAIHEILNDALSNDKSWKRIELYDANNIKLYPFDESNAENTKKFEYEIIFRNQRFGVLHLNVDMSGAIVKSDELNESIMNDMIIYFAVVCILFIYIMDRFLVRRVIKLSNNTKKLIFASKNEELVDYSLDEIGVLTRNYEKLKFNFYQNEEKLLERSATAESLLEIRSRFIANTSHEIRTPLNGMLGMTDILIENERNEMTKEKLSIIKNSGNLLLSIINDILDFSKIDQKKLTLEFLPTNLNQIIKDVTSILRNNAEEKNITLTVQASDDIPVVLIDPTRLSQVVSNLVGNAIKFTQKGGVVIDLKVKSNDEKRAQVALSVSDTGIGIEESKISKLFDPFTQEDASTSRKFGGTGLGLTISKNIVDLFGGTIDVKSQKGKGTTFIINLDLEIVKTEVSLNKSKRKVDFDGSDYTLLVAEDNAINRNIIELHLAKMKFNFDFAYDGQMAVDMVKENNYDFILMDMQMPNKDGLEATREILAAKETSHYRIIAMTANAMQEDKERCLEAGMIGFLTKPVNRIKLIDEISRHISFEKQASKKSS